jgi:hypothetical protein
MSAGQDAPGLDKPAGRPVEQDLLARYTGFEAPAENVFNPALKAPEELQRFGLPPRPDPDLQPLLRRVWDRVFDRDIRLLRFEPDRELFNAVRYRILRRALSVLSPAQTRAEASSNWSGAYITSNEGKRFLQVWGIWQTPDNLLIPPPPPQGRPGIDYVVANWIGLDGQRRYFDSSLPQMGTSSILQPDGKTVRVDPWVQWWAADDLNPKVVPIPITVEPGDMVACILTVCDPHTVHCVMTNLNPAHPDTQVIEATAPPVPDGGVTAQPSVTGATAEWIVERPTVLHSTTPNNLPNYGETGFELCIAVEGKGTGLLPLLNGVPQDMSGARMIRMYDTLPDPARTVFTSMPRKADDLTLRVRYGGFN